MNFKKKEFDLFGTRYTIEYVDKIEAEEGSFIKGQTNSAAGTIQIAKKDYNNNIVDPSDHKITLIHELLHAILLGGQYIHSSEDEPLVEWVARCLKSLMDQKII